MAIVIRKLLTFWRMPLREKTWFFLFYPYSGIIRLAILTLPFRILSPRYGVFCRNDQLSTLVTSEQQLTAWRMGRMADQVSCYTPWESKCLVQALMVRTLLGYYRIPYVMHLGATLTDDSNEPMKAHAWVRVGRWVVSGGDGHQAFGIVGSFVSPLLADTREHLATPSSNSSLICGE
jgi:hypothetical protein